MNSYIVSQIKNMETMLMTFEQACKLAAIQDDGKIGKDEDKLLKRINKATEEYKDELKKCRD